MTSVCGVFFQPCGRVPWPGIELKTPMMKVPSHNHWTTREFPVLSVLNNTQGNFQRSLGPFIGIPNQWKVGKLTIPTHSFWMKLLNITWFACTNSKSDLAQDLFTLSLYKPGCPIFRVLERWRIMFGYPHQMEVIECHTSKVMIYKTGQNKQTKIPWH